MQIISISGPVAAGKTTLLNRLIEYYGNRAAFHEERPQNNPFIREYYTDSARWSFHSQIAFLALYFDEELPADGLYDHYFYDRCFIENLVLARFRLENGDLTVDEYAIIEKMAKGIDRFMPRIDKYIYLECPVPLLCERLKLRGREYERELGINYATLQKRLYDEWAATLPSDRVLVIDQTKEIDFERIIRFIES